MIRTNLLQPSEARKIVDQRGMYTLVEYEKDLSVRPEFAAEDDDGEYPGCDQH